MAKDSKTTPSQRLLELIRNPDQARTLPAVQAGPGAAKPARPRRQSLFSLAGPVSIGVDIGSSQLVCVKVRGHDADAEILATSVVPLPPDAAPGSQAFVAILRQTLSDLCGPGPVPHIWAAVQSPRVNLQFVTIPKVASRQVDNAVFWTAKKEMGFDEASMVFDFERRGEVSEKGAQKLGALAYVAPRDVVRQTQNDFARAGFPLTGLTLEPFAHQTLHRRHIVTGNGGATANLHVGQDWSRLEIFSNGDLMFVRVIKTSMSGMEQAVLEALELRREEVAPAPVSAPTPPGPLAMAAPDVAEESVIDLDARGGDENGLVLELEVPAEPAPVPGPVAAPVRPAVRLEEARELLRGIVFGCDTLETCHPGQGVSPEDVMDMLDPVASRLVRQVEMTLKHYRESLGYEAVTRLTVSGFLGASRLFVSFIGAQLGLPCAPLDPLGQRRASGRPMPELSAPAVCYTQALGLAVSDTATTPSALFTYREKAEARAAKRLEQGSLVVLILILAGLAVSSLAALSTRRTLAAEREGLARELAGFGGQADTAGLARMTAELTAKREAVRMFVVRNQAVGVWSEALALAPEGVGLGTLTAELGPPKERVAAKGQPSKEPPAAPSRLVLEGVVTGDGRLFDSRLASYVVALEGSPLFENVSVKKSELEPLDGGATGLRFIITVGLPES